MATAVKYQNISHVTQYVTIVRPDGFKHNYIIETLQYLILTLEENALFTASSQYDTDIWLLVSPTPVPPPPPPPSGQTTDDLPEGVVNFYYHIDTARADLLTSYIVSGDTTHAPTSDAIFNLVLAASSSFTTKLKFNGSLAPISAHMPVALKSDGTVVLADADGLGTQMLIGFALDLIPVGGRGRVLISNPNAAGVLTGSGFTPGETIMLSKTPGVLTNDLGIFNPATDTILKVGIADCADGIQSSIATDLIMSLEILSSP